MQSQKLELVKEPQESITIRVVNDTTRTKYFKIETIQEKIILSEGGWSIWEEIVCNNDITSMLITNIKMGLTAQNYFKGEINGVNDAAFKESLKQFQLDHQLPSGGITIKTIQLLGLETN